MLASRRNFLFGLSGALAFPAIVKFDSLMKLGTFATRDDLIIHPKWEVFDTKTRLLVMLDEPTIMLGGARYIPHLRYDAERSLRLAKDRFRSMQKGFTITEAVTEGQLMNADGTLYRKTQHFLT